MVYGTPTQASRATNTTVVGVDVGGPRKGYHAVSLFGGRYHSSCGTTEVDDLVTWCRNLGAAVIAIDAPSRWSTDGRARPAERQLMAKGIACFSSPTREQALVHPKNYFGWMLRGMELFEALAHTHPRMERLPTTGFPVCLETFPHAITWQMRGGNAAASQKREQRRELLATVGIDLTDLTNIDWVDAALCAWAAHQVATAQGCESFGERETGFIIVPDRKP